MKYAGVDGCPAGWVLAPDEGPVQVFPTFAGVIEATAEAALVLVDIPMGLDDQRHLRACERIARELLGARRSSIFPVPVRAAVHAPDYLTASAVNFAATGKKLSMQSWNICRKIAEADLALRAQPALQGRVRESHPELCFAALNGWRPLTTSKKTREGQAERLALLERHTPGVTLPTGIRRSAAARDDILDAMVLAVSARLAAENGLPAAPDPPETDALGLIMAIVTPYHPGR
ncbi:MAG TPA: DUF429 domain-containing protein [Symbiobacteriaceae bacterium]|nr:DUF429 domain-containing protein [Symbiobacteriaceae bacterium]